MKKEDYYCSTIEDCINQCNIYADFFLNAINSVNINNVSKNNKDFDSNLLFQMMFLKTLTLKINLNGIEFTTTDKQHTLNNIIDPINISLITRNIYETLATFYMIFINPKNKNEEELLYNLWILSGCLNKIKIVDNRINAPRINIELYKKKFNLNKSELDEINLDIEEYNIKSIEKFAIEKENLTNQIEDLKNKITSNSCFISSKKDIKDIVKTLGDKFIYNITDKNELNQIHWHKCISFMNFNKNFTDGIFRLLSIECHPNHQSVIRFKDYFSESKPYIEISVTNAIYSFGFISKFIIEYCNKFQEIKLILDSLSIENQNSIIFFYNLYSDN